MSMKSVACVLIVALCFTHAVGLNTGLSFDVEAAKNRPVSKVINLLKDMLKQLEKEGEDDEEVYDQMACWCETYDKEKTKAIASGESRIEDLTGKIEELTGLSAQLNTEIKILSEEVSKNQDALDEATAMRQKQLADFTAEEKEMLSAISALKQAITVLSKQNSASMLQLPQLQMMRLAATLQYQLQKHSSLFQGVLTDSQHQEVAAFVESPQDYFDAEPTFKQSYAPKSGAIFGILNQMKETFETNLSSSQKEEGTNLKAYEDLKAAKETEITAGQEQVDSKTIELADTDEKNAESKEDLTDTKATLVEDEKFLAMLKEKCADVDAQWEERQKTRQLEMEATSKALEILSGDDAHDLFTKTFNPAFVQKESSKHSSRRSQASKVLSAAAKKMDKPRLAALAYRLRLTPDAQAKVEKAIDGLIADLAEEKAEEIKHKEFCVDEFNKVTLDTERKTREKEDLVAKIEDLDMTMKMLADTITMLQSDIFDMNKQLKKAGEERAKQNKEFQQCVADQRATQQLLTKALEVLEGFYGKKAAALVQNGKQSVSAGQAPPPPPGFADYSKNKASGGVMGMIKKIIDDAKTMESEATRSETEAQEAYDNFVKETTTSIDTKTKDITNKTEEKAKAEADHVEALDDKDTVMIKLEQLSNYNGELHQSCDFVMKNFETRQTARDEEVEALRQAEAILSGAKF